MAVALLEWAEWITNLTGISSINSKLMGPDLIKTPS